MNDNDFTQEQLQAAESASTTAVADATGVSETVVDNAATDPGAQTAQTPEDAAAQTAQATQKEEQANGFKRRVDRLNQKLSEREQEIEYWKKVALQNANVIPQEQVQTPQPAFQPVAPITTDRPDISQFDDIGKYTEALTDWKLQQTLNQMNQQRELEQLQHQQIQLMQSYQSRAAEFMKTAPDFNEAIAEAEEMGAPPLGQEVISAIMESEVGPQISYWLAKNVNKAVELAQMSPARRMKEIGKIEAQFTKTAPTSTTAPTTRQTAAPAPIKPVNGSAPKPTKSEYEMTPQEYMAYRNSLKGRRP